ncbi:MAG: replication-associated recombination protein A [Bacteroidia bacterium]|nr:replication-associated recombination protein A [Bacteroidia bacterium]MBP9689121.1 replication-associated recombination protein A [Bacteroidia bacterium]
MNTDKPLAERVRPTNLEQYIGQEHLTAMDAPLRKAIQSKIIPSIIFWGPPGVGKTTLARIIGQELGLKFYQLSAISAGVAEVRKVIEDAKNIGKVLLFLDEIHRFNKSQQDALLGAVESGRIVLIGATTENPSFEVNNALLSRCQVYVLNELDTAALTKITNQAIENDEVLKQKEITIEEHEALFLFSGGDARKLLNIIEIIANQPSTQITITNKLVQDTLQKNIALHDKDGEAHYNIISAFIKSIRGSDPNAAVYWLARMLAGGEDPKFIARRLLILSSEDIGNANPNALLIANQTFAAINVIGMPEARIILSQCVTYLACSPKSNAAYLAINKAMDLVSKNQQVPVPIHLRNAPTKLMKEMGYGKDYKYAHDYENNFVNVEFLPQTLIGTNFYNPGDNARENEQRTFLKQRWKEKYGY